MRLTQMCFFRKLLTPLVVLVLASVSFYGYAAVSQNFLDDSRKAVKDASRAKGLQTELPGDKAESGTDKSPGKDWNFDPDINVDGRTAASWARMVLYAAIAAIVIIVLLNLGDNLWSRSKSRRLIHKEREEEEAASTVARMDQAQFEADDLAGQGSFAEAMHVLLLRSVFELRRRLDVPIAASLTSREILNRVRLPGDGRAFFADIIGRVEISYFGLHEPGKEDYLACRRSFERLTEALKQGAER